ncbi:Crp/Fnr family transcriptional regulator [Nisaea acidiphila]|uniref:Crp/Fnr family transcriptional regulator n=1 Tax=Nisaea acidiphila TaxID=1862145 RepID=A0A9J7APS7_9PROT|nr:Crp/Fnr family transcriptional regulator [Nisaea acidiphila]UUX49223.1 Crp/Fnr family transcriptional regulator [Nisaea acidiphila]
MVASDGDTIRRFPIFGDLPASRAQELADRCNWQRYAKGRQILGQQDGTSDLFLVVTGSVHIVGYSGAGKAVSYGDISAGEVFGEFSAIDRQPRSASVTALSDCLVGRMTSSDFRDVLATEPRVALNLLETVVAKTRLLSERVFDFSTLTVESRLHVELLRLAGLSDNADASAVLNPAPTHQEIADRISTRRETVTRELNRLAEDGVLSLGRRLIEVRDAARLRDMVDRARLF